VIYTLRSLGVGIACALVLITILALTPLTTAEAQTVVGASTSTSSTTQGARKTFFDPASGNHWVFFYNGTAIEYESSTDGTTWTSRGTQSYNTANFSVAYKSIGGTSYVFLATEANTYDISLIRGTISGTTITWETAVTALDGTSASDTYGKPVVSLDTSGYVWVGAVRDFGATLGERYQAYLVRTTNAGSSSIAFNSSTAVGGRVSNISALNLVPLSGSEMLLAEVGESSQNLLAYRFDGATWVSAATGGERGWSTFAQQGVGGRASALAMDSSGNLYAGGNFTVAGNVMANYIAKWNGTSWSTLGAGMNGNVRAVALDSSGNLYAGGNFTTAGGTTVNYIAKWNGATWSALGSGMSGAVLALAFDSGGTLHAAGAFTTAGGVSAPRVAKWNGTSWQAVGGGTTNGNVNALTIDSSNKIYIGGPFTTAGGVAASYIAQWNGTAWSAVGGGTSGTVNALRISSSGTLYAGGQFATAGGVTVNNIAAWNSDTGTWSALGTGWDE
jgi:hypothetical protein